MEPLLHFGLTRRDAGRRTDADEAAGDGRVLRGLADSLVVVDVGIHSGLGAEAIAECGHEADLLAKLRI